MKSYIITSEGVSMFIDGKPLSAEKSHPKYNDILTAVRSADWDGIPALVNIAIAIEEFAVDSGVEVDAEAGIIRYRGEIMQGYLVERIISMMHDGFDINPMVRYLENLLANPTKRAIDELHKFNEYGKMPITDDGCFIAYKLIRGWYDTHTGEVLNKPSAQFDDEDHKLVPYTTNRGVTVAVENNLTTVSMHRSKVDDDATRTCSQGLHFCSQEYLKSFSGDRIVVLKINPADVVSIPVDYNNTKGRCWKYQIIDVLSDEEFREAMGRNIFTQSVYVAAPNESEIEDDDEWVEIEDDADTSASFNGGYAIGYNIGYKHGRNGEYDLPSDADAEVAAGYDEGFKDGRGHKKKRQFE